VLRSLALASCCLLQGFNTQFPPGIVDPAVDGLTKVGRLMALAQEHGGKHLALIHDHLAAVPVAQVSEQSEALTTFHNECLVIQCKHHIENPKGCKKLQAALLRHTNG
jgi:hypothetical protein